MARELALSELRSLCRDEAEIPSVITNTTLDRWINLAATELTAFVVDHNPDHYLDSYDIPVVAGTSVYDVPDDFFAERGLETVEGGETYDLGSYEWSERNKFSSQSSAGLTDLAYCVMNDAVHFRPVPQASGTVTMWFTPTYANMVLDADTFDGKFGWEAFIVQSVGARFARRMAEDSIPFERELERVKREIKSQIVKGHGGPVFVKDVEYSGWEFLRRRR